jgi:GcrA cell cycle regulator
MDWTAEAIDHLRSLWAEGHSTAEIGRRMGVTKNAVIGKAHRLSLPARPSPIRREAESGGHGPRPARAPRAAPPPRPDMPLRRLGLPSAGSPPAAPGGAGPVIPATVASAEATAAPTPGAPAPAPSPAVVRPFPRASGRSCCWPLGDPGTPEFRFCGGESLAGKPYCAEHAAVAYVKARDRREDAA